MNMQRLLRLGVLALAVGLGGCGGGGGGGGGGSGATATISGAVSYDFVPNLSGALDYKATASRAVRGAGVDIVDSQTGAVLASTATDGNGQYLHSRGGDPARRDGNFQGYGRFETGRDGAYRFRTIRPVPYPGRTPHIHVAVTPPGQPRFTTQCYVRGEPLNARDGILNAIRDPRARDSLIVDFAPLPDSPGGELSARFDIVLGLTAAQ